MGYTEFYTFLIPLYGLSIVIPPAMGMIADRWGAGQSFVILGTLMVVLCAPVTLITRRAARTAAEQKIEPTSAD